MIAIVISLVHELAHKGIHACRLSRIYCCVLFTRHFGYSALQGPTTQPQPRPVGSPKLRSFDVESRRGSGSDAPSTVSIQPPQSSSTCCYRVSTAGLPVSSSTECNAGAAITGTGLFSVEPVQGHGSHTSIMHNQTVKADGSAVPG